MKKGIIALVGVVVLAAAAYFGYSSYVKAQVPDMVRAALKKLPAGVEVTPAGITFNPASNTLTLDNVAVKLEMDKIKMAGTVKQIRCEGIELSAKNPAPDEVPLVASLIAVEGVRMNLIQDKINMEYNVASYELKNIFLNAPVLLTSWQEGKQSKDYTAFWDNVVKMRIDSLVMTNYETKVVAEGKPTLTTKVVRSESSMKDGKGNGVMEGMTLDMPKGTDGTPGMTMAVKGMEIKGVEQPSGKLMNSLLKFSFMSTLDPNDPEVQVMMKELTDIFIAEYSTKPIFSSFSMNNMGISVDGAEGKMLDFSMGGMESTMAVAPTKFGVKLTDIKGVSATPFSYLGDALGVPLVADSTDMSFDMTFRPAPETSSIAMSLSSPNLASVTTQSDVKLPLASLMELSNPQSQNKLMGTTIASAKATLVDKGITNILLKSMGEDEDLTPAEMRDGFLELVSDFSEMYNTAGQKTLVLFWKQVEEFLKNPGTFTVSFTPPAPVNALALIMDQRYIKDPEGNGISIIATPGKAEVAPK